MSAWMWSRTNSVAISTESGGSDTRLRAGGKISLPSAVGEEAWTKAPKSARGGQGTDCCLGRQPVALSNEI